jgi:hypothetical protein
MSYSVARQFDILSATSGKLYNVILVRGIFKVCVKPPYDKADNHFSSRSTLIGIACDQRCDAPLFKGPVHQRNYGPIVRHAWDAITWERCIGGRIEAPHCRMPHLIGQDVIELSIVDYKKLDYSIPRCGQTLAGGRERSCPARDKD